MVVSPEPIEVLDDLPLVINASNSFKGIPVVDLSNPDDAKTIIVEACQEIGFFKVINHGISMEFIGKFENEAIRFFELPIEEKEKYSWPGNQFRYGKNVIGCNGDVGWVEYLLFWTDPGTALPALSESLMYALVHDYVLSVENLSCKLLQLIAEGLKLERKTILSDLIKDKRSDPCLRLNRYPPLPEPEARSIGFGDHTDPQLISVARSNNIQGLQIFIETATSWVSVPPDPSAFFVNIGDSLQVMTNDRFKSVKHRVLAGGGGPKPRVSMIFFGGPPLSQIIKPLSSVMRPDEDALYDEFTWSQYKKFAAKTRLGDDRLSFFRKYAPQNL